MPSGRFERSTLFVGLIERPMAAASQVGVDVQRRQKCIGVEPNLQYDQYGDVHADVEADRLDAIERLSSVDFPTDSADGGLP